MLDFKDIKVGEKYLYHSDSGKTMTVTVTKINYNKWAQSVLVYERDRAASWWTNERYLSPLFEPENPQPTPFKTPSIIRTGYKERKDRVADVQAIIEHYRETGVNDDYIAIRIDDYYREAVLAANASKE